ncbi:MAG: helix-turn-helix domain-containing protein [Lewinellaceae bacterium]|nr:helix-turn-helix domain-containing protein [Lewinellaceae bacterium]
MEKKIILEITLSELREIVREEFHLVLQTQKKGLSSSRGNVKRIMDINDACKYLSLSKSTLYKMTSQGAIPHRKPGKRLYFIKTELDAWVEGGKDTSLDGLRRDMEQHLHRNRKEPP